MSRIDYSGSRTRAAIEDAMMRASGKESNYERLFGTPERAARTIAGLTCDGGGCEGCTLYGANCSYDADALLGWLREEGEVE